MTQVFKRTLLAAVAAATLTAFTGLTAAQAAAPMASFSAPAFYRFKLGDFEITPVSDGTVDMPADQLVQQKPEKTVRELAEDYLTTPLETSVNAYVINTGTKLVLVDTGAGVLYGPTLGRFVANLKAAGYQPEQIDEVYITHMHTDHVGGLVSNGARVFPNATVRAGKADADFWLSAANAANAPPMTQPQFQGDMLALTPYVQAGKFKPIFQDGELIPGVSALATPGHSPGHTAYVVESRGQKLVLVGDMIHVGAVQFDNPNVTLVFDSDPKAAAGVRRAVFDDAARRGYLVGGAHIAFPGVGHLRKEGKGYRWIPVNFTQAR